MSRSTAWLPWQVLRGGLAPISAGFAWPFALTVTNPQSPLKITISKRRALTNDLDAFIHSGCTLILRLNCLAFGKRFVGQDMAQTISTV